MSALDQYCLSVFLARLIFLNEKHDRYRERECHLGGRVWTGEGIRAAYLCNPNMSRLNS